MTASALAPGEGEYVDGVPLRDSFSAAEREQALAAAQAFLAGYDYDAVERDQAVEAWREEESAVRAAQTPDERQPRLTGVDLEVHAVSTWVIEDLRTALAEQGLDIEAIAVGTGWRCDR